MSGSPRFWFLSVAELRNQWLAHCRSCPQCAEAPNRPQRCAEGAALYQAFQEKQKRHAARWGRYRGI